MKKKYKFYDKIYFATVIVKVGEPLDKLRNAGMTTLDIDNKKGGTKRYYLINLDNKKDFYSLMHECLHLVRRIFDDRGVEFRAENDEAIAYYFMYWFKQIWRRINK